MADSEAPPLVLQARLEREAHPITVTKPKSELYPLWSNRFSCGERFSEIFALRQM